MSEMNHFDSHGNAVMVDVSEKQITLREAVAQGSISVSSHVISTIQYGRLSKGDVLGVARIAGIMAAKRTGELIPLCHPILLTKCSIDFQINNAEHEIIVTCLVRSDGQTGVEMEALTGVSTALLTIYDMCKSIDKGMVIQKIHLVRKSGGRSGDYFFEG